MPRPGMHVLHYSDQPLFLVHACTEYIQVLQWQLLATPVKWQSPADKVGNRWPASLCRVLPPFANMSAKCWQSMETYRQNWGRLLVVDHRVIHPTLWA